MKLGSFVPGSLLGGDKVQSLPATLRPRLNASMSIGEGSIGEGSRLVGMDDGNRSPDLRSFVAGRFMHMLRAHDRVRIKVLQHPTHAR